MPDLAPPDLAPLIVTAGEPAGIGPELCLALAEERGDVAFGVLGNAEQLGELAKRLLPELTVTPVGDDPADWPEPRKGTLLVLPLDYPVPIEAGKPNPKNAAAMLDGLARAIDGCQEGRFRGLVTGPLQKSTVVDSGIAFSGHTEYLAERTRAAMPVMLLVANDLRVALATTHLPLKEVPAAITSERLEQVLRVLNHDLETTFGIESPRIVVCGLNPHAGESGHLGAEDDTVIRPVVEALADEGMNVVGPLPADTAFTPAAGKSDAILAMYHDQGLPVLKFAGFGHAVNVTLGLPIVRTSVDHGTALDKAGTGTADPGSLLAAFDLADRVTRP